MYNIRKHTKRENFKPQVDWIEDHYNHMLVIQLPGFKREEIRVQHNKAGKLFIKGSRLATDNKYIDVDQSFDVPKDVNTEKISGQFDDGLLLLTMPKNEIAEAEAVTKEKTLSDAIKEEKSKQEAAKEKELKQENEKHEQGKIDKEKEDGDAKKENTTSNEAMQNEANQMKDDANQASKAPTRENEKETTGTSIIQNELSSKPKAEEMPNKNFDKYNEDVENQKIKTDEDINRPEEKKFEQVAEDIKENNNEKVNAISAEVKSNKERTRKTMQKMKLKMHGIYRDTQEEMRRKINKIRGGDQDRWLNSKYIGGAVEKINRNKNMIAIAVTAFSVGLYASQKLKRRND